MGQVLYRKYRPRSFSEVVGQQAIVDTLQRAIASGRVSHAYLFSGPKGVGKTSVARILAHEVNKLPYSDESIHLDIIEIDGASNRRIDEIRELRDKVNITPTSSKYKVYIIDEVHMLTKEAFNALLKTLEEPPAHCIFILATTEAHKLPDTIVSRTQHFNFKSLESKTAVEHLEKVAKREKIIIDKDALELLAIAGDGSFRDSLSLLDQLSHVKGKVTEQNVREITGSIPLQHLDEVKRAINEGKLKAIIEWTQKIRTSVLSPARVAAQLADSLRADIISSSADQSTPKLLRDLLEVNGAKQPLERLEIALLEAAASNAQQNPSPQPKIEIPEPVSETAPETMPPVKIEELGRHIEESGANDDNPTVSAPDNNAEFSLERWPEVVELIRQAPGGLHSALRQAKPQLEDDKLELIFNFPLHQKKVAKSENLRIIGDYIEQLSGQRLRIDCIVEKVATSAQPAAKNSQKPEDLQTISSIFGSAEVLES